jgi:hypothetical protein
LAFRQTASSKEGFVGKEGRFTAAYTLRVRRKALLLRKVSRAGHQVNSPLLLFASKSIIDQQLAVEKEIVVKIGGRSKDVKGECEYGCCLSRNFAERISV